MAVEERRGCGYRKIGGTYLEAEAGSFECGRVPLLLKPCDSCHHEIKFTRGLQEIRPSAMLHAAETCNREFGHGFTQCLVCPMATALAAERAGLMWVGGKYYPTPEVFTAEAARMGVSKRIKWPVPKFIEPGKTWVFLAHERGHRVPCSACGVAPHVLIEGAPGQGCETCGGSGSETRPAVFYAFVVKRIVRIVPDTMSEAEREGLRARGLEPVVVPAGDPDHGGR